MGIPKHWHVVATVVIAAALTAGCGPSAQVWTGPSQTVTAYPGSAHCNMDAVLFLDLDGLQYVFDAGTTLDRQLLMGEPQKKSTLPADATDTGLRRGKSSVWLAADGNAAFVVSKDSAQPGDPAQLWPRALEPIRCD